MGKKVTNTILFLAVLGAAAGMTVYVGQGAVNVMVYNFVFLGIMAAIYLTGLLAGMFKMNNMAEAFSRAADLLPELFKQKGKADSSELTSLNGIFQNRYLDRKMDNFTGSISKSQEGIGDIEEYINEEEIDIHIHKRLLEMVPDILTSLGILGTFVGLVWGLKNFEPNNYEAMTSSVSSLVDGIKVAFLTSIYGISLSVVYTYGVKSEYSGMTERLGAFLEKFHAYVLPTAENESRNLLVSSQKHQTAAMKQMAEQFSVQMADSFEKVITPTFRKMNDSLDLLTTSVTRCQKDAIKEILDTFLEQMHDSFKMEFGDFNEALAQLKKAQKENADYTADLYKNMSQQLGESYVRQEKMMKDMVAQMGTMQGRYMTAANRIIEENQEIQKMQQQDYQRISDYLKDAEKSAAKFWVACNQTMQKYIETAAQAMEKVSDSGMASEEFVKANRKIAESYAAKMQEFIEYQRLAYNTMEQVRRLLSDISVSKSDKDIYLSGGKTANGSGKEVLGKLEETIREQSNRQEALLEDIAKNMRELSRTQSKGKFSLFK